MAKILIIAEHLNGKLNSSTARCVTCALDIKADAIDVLVLAADAAAIAAEAAQITGVARVLTIARSENAHALAAILAPQIAAVAGNGYTHVLAPSTTFGKDVTPSVAALLGVAQVSDIMAVDGAYSFKRPIYAGNAIITVEAAPSSILVGTVRTASYAAAAVGATAAPIEALTLDVSLPTHTRFVELAQGKSDRPDLQGASRVLGWPCTGLLGQLRHHLQTRGETRRSRRRLARRRRCRLRAE